MINVMTTMSVAHNSSRRRQNKKWEREKADWSSRVS